MRERRCAESADRYRGPNDTVRNNRIEEHAVKSDISGDRLFRKLCSPLVENTRSTSPADKSLHLLLLRLWRVQQPPFHTSINHNVHSIDMPT